ncbi:MAG TPA: hypothetical protein VHO84_12225, partial [Syntrophorhabdaceae bacterium]|nr:hypothetical protein [Syntrophorhabdaceae bacterium]
MPGQKNISKSSANGLLVRNYALSFLAFFSFLAATQALIPTIPIYLAGLGTKEGEIGILIGAFGVASLLSRFIAGYLLRMQSERRIMLWGAVLFFCVYL